MAKNIQDVRSLSAPPQRNWSWEVSIVSLSTGNEEGLTAQAQSVTLPASSAEAFQINYKSKQTYFSGRDSSDNTVTITFYDTEALTVYNFFQGWFDNLIVNPVTGGGAPRELSTAEVILKTMATDEETVTSTTRLKNAFPTNIGEVSLDYETNEAMTVEITLQYDQKLFSRGA